MEITRLDAVRVRIPQKPPIAPYQSRYRACSAKEALLVCLETDNGLVGWGKTPDDWINRTYEGVPEDALRAAALGRDPFDIEGWCVASTLGVYLSSAAEMACWDLMGKAAKQPLYRLLGGAIRQRVELATCMGIRPYEEAKALARQYVEMGFSTLKTKAGRQAAEDLEMVRGIRDGVGDRLRLRIDPNMGYTPEMALQLAKALEAYNLEYFEQPMHFTLLAESARIRKRTSTPPALNESVTTPEGGAADPAARRRGCAAAGHAPVRRDRRSAEGGVPVRSGEGPLRVPLLARPGLEDSSDAPRRREYARVHAGQRLHVLRAGGRHPHAAAPDRAWHDGGAAGSGIGGAGG
jgi:L-alanine-DL-glutamate epimerase-like enolase superfamily enzyme